MRKINDQRNSTARLFQSAVFNSNATKGNWALLISKVAGDWLWDEPAEGAGMEGVVQRAVKDRANLT